MKVSELMAAMADAGAPMEAILIAVRALEERDAVIEQKRAVERDRKRRQRELARDSHGTVTGQSCDIPGTVAAAPALSPSPNENNSNPHPHTHPDNNTRAREASPAKAMITKPEDVSEQVWGDFLTHRKAKKAPVTQTVLDTIRREAVKAGWAMDAALAEVSARGWQGFKAEWVAEKSGSSGAQPAGSDPMVAAILAKRRAAA